MPARAVLTCPAAVLAFAVATAPVSQLLSQAPPPLYEIPREAVSITYLWSPGIVIASFEDRLAGFDARTGRERWSRPDLPNTSLQRFDEALHPTNMGAGGQKADLPELAVLPVPGTDWALLYAYASSGALTVHLIDGTTGVSRWSSAGLGGAEVLGATVIAEDSLVLVGVGRGARGGDDTALWAVDATSATVRWKSAGLFSRPLARLPIPTVDVERRGPMATAPWPLKDSDSTAVLFVAEGELTRISVETGDRVWAAVIADATPPTRGDGHAAIAIEQGTLYVPYERALAGVDLETGRVRWTTTRRLPGQVSWIELVPAGLLVRGRPAMSAGRPVGKAFVDLLDPGSGASRWKEGKAQPDYTSNPLLTGAGNGAFAAASGTLARVDLATGAADSIGDLQFEHGERPTIGEWVDHDLLFWSAQNITRVDTSGTVKYHLYLAPPGQSALAKVAIVASVAVLGVYGLPMTAFWGRKHQATADAERFVMMLAGRLPGDGGVGLVLVDKATGSIARRLPLEGPPLSYFFDQARQLVLVRGGDGVVRAYSI